MLEKLTGLFFINFGFWKSKKKSENGEIVACKDFNASKNILYFLLKYLM